MKSPVLVSDQRTLDAHCEQWRAAGRFAFDTEFIRDETYDAVLCLIQVCVGDEVTLVDPTGGLDVSVFWKLVTDPTVATIVHAGKEDFDVCLRMTGQPPRNVFDVQLAAGFVGYHYPLSLVRMVDQVLGRRIAKGQTLTDWLRRPLTDEQLRYAVEDVAYLPTIYNKLLDKLEKAGRVAWVEEEFRRFEDPEYYRPPTEDRLFKFKGVKKLDAMGMGVLARLVEWRDAWAKEKNRPIRALIRDDVLVEIARRRPRRASDLQVLRGFPQSRNMKIINELLALIEEGRATPAESLPQPIAVREDTPMTKAVLDLLSAAMRAICFEEDVAHELVGSSQRLRELMDYSSGELKEQPSLLGGWRGEFIGQRLLNLLGGRSELHFSGWPKNPRLEVVTHRGERKVRE